ncbi:GNAT family N-acetyltransferase [Acidaminobacter sp. JC074]|uniref:GNAT family N-acetyltransferase n=1 Tax=Acidaminobacter sp. JC074 TaxID=2530199 RepID=UPI001F1175A4|nr:GNAT family protein [Acidaminobacter sp. JC074]MCH4889634.1 GNAT family N-acetyltransferase [Acidaminobacter sp. JC074]
MVVLDTDVGSITIREGNRQDAQKVITFMNWVTGEVDYHTYGANDFHISIEDEIKVLELFHQRDNCLFLVAEFRGEIVAVASLSGGIKERVSHRGTVGITVAKRFWRLGIGIKMMELIIRYAEESKVLTKLELLVHQNNLPAIKLYNRLGFYREGVFKRYFKIDGKYYDGISMGLIVE